MAGHIPAIHFMRNLKFLYGSNQWVFTLNCAMAALPYAWVRPAFGWILMTTDSAGRSAAKPTRMLTPEAVRSGPGSSLPPLASDQRHRFLTVGWQQVVGEAHQVQ